MPTDSAKVANFDWGEFSLRHAREISDADREQLYDLFHSSDSPENLRAQLVDYPHVPDHVKELLVEDRARQDKIGSAQPQHSEAPKNTLGRAADALTEFHRVAQSSPKTVELAAKYPATAVALINASMKSRDNGPVISIDQSDIPPITAAGAIENQPQFRRAAKQAWDDTQRASMIAETDPSRAQVGHLEAGFTVDRKGKASAVSTNDEPKAGSGGSLEQDLSPNTMIAVHTHPMFDGTPRPSKNDVQIAERTGTPIAVQTKDGLFEADAQGNVRQVEKGTGWMDK